MLFALQISNLDVKLRVAMFNFSPTITEVLKSIKQALCFPSQDPDLSPPSCTVVKQTGTCAGVYGRPECVSSTWQARVMFTDAGEGLLSITTRENRDGTLTGRNSREEV